MTEHQFKQWLLLIQERQRESEMILAKNYFIFEWETKFCWVNWRNRWSRFTLGTLTAVDAAMIPPFTRFTIGRN